MTEHDTKTSSARRKLLSAAFWGYVGSSSALLWAGAAVVRAATAGDPKRELLHSYTSWWAYHYVLLSPFWEVTFEGRERVEEGRAYVLVANHQSMGDILVLFGLRKHFKWVSKASVFKVPFVGWNMVLNDYVRIERGERESVAEMMEACRRHLRAGSSVFLFPEGTRSADGQLKSFKHGAFTLSAELGVPIVPIVVEGTKDALPKHGWVFENASKLEVLVRVLDPVDPADFGGDRDKLMEHVYATMESELEKIRAQKVRAERP